MGIAGITSSYYLRVMKMQRLLAVDPSLTCSGWALFDLGNSTLLSVGKLRSLPPTFPLATRLRDLQDKIGTILNGLRLGSNDVLICEAPTTMRDPRAAFKVEQVRCLFEGLGRDRQALVPGRINPRSVQYEVMGLKGKQLQRSIIKETAVFVVQSTHAQELKSFGFDPSLENLRRNQDIVDAILIGRVGISWIESARHGGFTLEDFFHQVRDQRRMRRAV